MLLTSFLSLISSQSVAFIKPLLSFHHTNMRTTLGSSGSLLSKSIKATRTLKKSFLSPKWRLLMAQIIQCLGGKTVGHDQLTTKDEMILYCLANGVKVDFAILIWDDLILKLSKSQREKVFNYSKFISLMLEHKMGENYLNFMAKIIITPTFSVNNFTLKKHQPKGPPFTPHMIASCRADGPKDTQAPSTTLQAVGSVTKGTKSGARYGQRKRRA
ncbi:hypothetical protein Tco_0223513 [Tanacetum coccineum]